MMYNKNFQFFLFLFFPLTIFGQCISIQHQPAAQTVCIGSSLSFQILATATATSITYQWKKNNVDFGGATSSILNIPILVLGDEGDYTCELTSPCGSLTSNIAKLTLSNLPNAPTHVKSDEIGCVGTAITINSTGCATQNATTNWYLDGAFVKTGANLTLRSTTTGVFNYSAKCLKNGCESNPSSGVVLTINNTPEPPMPYATPSGTICKGENVSLSPTGTAFKWYVAATGGTASNNNAMLTNVQPTDANSTGIINRWVSETQNGCVSKRANITITVHPPTIIALQPISKAVCLGENATFNVDATGSDLTFQWNKNNVDLPNETNKSLTISNVKLIDKGDYTCKITGACGEILSEKVQLLINNESGPLVQNPIQFCKNTGIATNLNAYISGTNITWYTTETSNDGVSVSPNISTETVQKYTFWVTNKNENCESVRSQVSIEIVELPLKPQITENIKPVICTSEASFTLALNCEIGLPNFKKNDGDWTEGNSLIINPSEYIGINNFYFLCKNGACKSEIIQKSIEFLPIPNIGQQPINQTNCKSLVTYFQVNASAGESYQWQRKKPGEVDYNDLDDTMIGIDASKTPKLKLTSVGVENPHLSEYRVKVSNGICEVFSTPATLFVNSIAGTMPEINVCNNSEVTYNLNTISIVGAPIGFSWQTSLSEGSGYKNLNINGEQLVFNAKTDSNNHYYRANVQFLQTDGGTCNIATDGGKLSVLEVQPPVLQNIEICYGESTSINAVGCAGTLIWYDKPTGNEISMPMTFVKNEIIFAKCKTLISGQTCMSNASNDAQIIVKSKPPTIIISEDKNICIGQSTTLTATTNCTGIIKWSDGQTGNIINVKPSITTEYSSKCEENGCIGENSNIIKVTVNQNPALPVNTTNEVYCEGNELKFLANGTNLKWYLANDALDSINLPNYTAIGEYSIWVSQSNEFGCESERLKITSKILESPKKLIAIPVETCINSSVSIGITNPCSGELQWFDENNNLVSMPIIAINTSKHYAICKVGNCISEKSELVQITVNPIPVLPTNTSPTQICQGGSLLFTATGENLKWYETNTDLTESLNLTYTQSGKYTKFVSQTVNGCESQRLKIEAIINEIKITTQPISQSDCDGNSVSFKIAANATSGQTPTIQWQIKKPSDLDFTNISGSNSTTLSIANVGSTSNPTGSLYRCVLSDLRCEKISETTELKVNNFAGTLPNQTICGGSSATFDVSTFIITGSQPTTQWQYRAGTSGTWLDLTNETAKIISANTAGYYRCKATFINLDGSTCIQYSSSSGAKLSVNEVANLPTNSTPNSICSGSSLTFSAVGENLKWYETETGSASSITAPTVSNPNIYSYFVSQTIGNCESPRLKIVAEIKSAVAVLPISTTKTQVCQGESLTFTATGENLKWYENSTDITESQILTYTQAGKYTKFVSQTVNGCESQRLKVEAIINEIQITTQPISQSDCEGNSVSFKIAASATSGQTPTIQWQIKKPTDLDFINISASNSTTLSIANVGSTANPNGSIYRCLITDLGCEKISETTELKVNNFEGTLPSQTICGGSSATFDVTTFIITGSQPTTQWQYRAGTSGTWQDIQNETQKALTANTAGYYRCRATFNNLDGSTCIQYSSNSGAKLSVNEVANLPTNSTPISICSGSSLTFSAIGENLKWYETETGGASSITAPTVSNPNNYTYFVSQTIGNCESPRLKIVAEIKSAVAVLPISTTKTQVCQGESLTFTATGENLKWYDNNTDLTENLSLTFTQSGKYTKYVSQTVNGCESQRLKIETLINEIKITTQPISQSDCEGNSVSFKIAASASSGQTPTIQWQIKKPTDLDFTNISGSNTTTLNISTIGSTANPTGSIYRCLITDLGCEKISETAELKVYNFAGSLASQTICGGSTATFDVTTFIITGSQPTTQWQYRAGTSGTWQDLINETAKIISAITAGYYRCKATFINLDGSTCIQYSSSSGAKLSVNEVANLPTNSIPNSICSGSSLTFSAVGENLKWYETETGSASSITAPTVSNPNIYTYFVSQTIGNCESPRLKIVAEIKSAVAVLPISTTKTQVCQGESLTFTATGENLKWYENVTDITESQILTYTQAGKYTKFVSQIVNGCESQRLKIEALINEIKITTEPISQSDCEGNSVSFKIVVTTTSAQISTFQWQIKKPSELEFTNISGSNSTTLSIANVGSTVNPTGSLYRCLISDLGCEKISETAELKVNNFAGTLPSQTICGGSSATFDITNFTITGSQPTTQWQYRAGTSGTWQDIQNETSNTLTANTAGYYRCKATFSNLDGSTCIQYSSSSGTKLTVNEVANLPTNSTPISICSGSSLTFSAVGENLKWYETETGGASSITAPTVSNPNNYTYFVSQTIGNCESPRLKIVAVIKSAVAVLPISTTKTQVCQGESLTFTATGDNLKWYDNNTDLTESQILTYTQSGKYTKFVSQTVNGCESQRLKIEALINEIKITTQPISQSDCEGNSVSFKIAANATSGQSPTFQWQIKKPNDLEFTNISGSNTTTLSIANVGSTANPNGSLYRCLVTDLGCEKISESAELKVNNFAGTLPSQTICGGSSATFDITNYTITGSQPTVQWQYRAGTSGTWQDIQNETQKVLTANISGYYRCKATFSNLDGSTCVQYSSSSGAKLSLNEVANLPTNSTPISICSGSSLTFSAIGENLKWYETETGGTSTSAAPTVSNPNIYTYFVSQTIGNCESPRLKIVAEIKAAVAVLPISTTPTQICEGQSLTFSATGENLKWYENATDITESLSLTYTQAGKYTKFVSQTVNGCESQRLKIEAIINEIKITTQPISQSDCEGNSVSFKIAANATSGQIPTIQWQIKKPSELEFTNISGSNSTTLSIANVGSTANPNGSLYRCLVTDLGCEKISDTAELKVNNFAGTLSSQTICGGNKATFDVSTFIITGSQPTTQWQYRTGTSGTWQDLTNETTKVLSVNTTGYYRCKAAFSNLDGSTCVQYSSSGGTNLSVNEISEPPMLKAKNAICVGGMANDAIDGLNLLFYDSLNKKIENSVYKNSGDFKIYVTQNTTGCESKKALLEVKVIEKPVSPKVTYLPFCSKEVTVLSAKGCDGPNSKVNWYSTRSSKMVIYSGNEFKTPPVTSTREIFFSCINEASNGCESVRDSITILPLPTLSTKINYPKSSCIGTKILPSKSTNSNGLFKLEEANGATINQITGEIFANIAGLYHVEYEVVGFCGIAKDSIYFVPNPTANAGLGSTLTGNETYNLTGITTASGGTPPYKFTWDPEPNVTVSTKSPNSISNPSIGPFNQNTLLMLTLKDANGCVATSNATINYTNCKLSAAIIGNTSLCGGKDVEGITSVLLKANIENANENYTINWKKGGKIIGNENELKANTAGEYTLNVVDGLGCVNNIKTTVTMVTPTIPKVFGTSVCEGNSISLQSTGCELGVVLWQDENKAQTSSSIIPKTTSNYYARCKVGECVSDTSKSLKITILQKPLVKLAYPSEKCIDVNSILPTSFSPKNGIFSVLDDKNKKIDSISGKLTDLQVGKYMISYSAMNSCGISVETDSLIINPLPKKPVISQTGVVEICQGKSTELKVTEANKYYWNTRSTKQSIAITDAGYYSVRVANEFGCYAYSDSTLLVVNALPSPPIIEVLGKTTFCEGENVVLKANDNQNYIWSNSLKTQNIKVDKSGSFSVKTINEKGCESLKSNVITVLEKANPSVPKLETSNLYNLLATQANADYFEWKRDSTLLPETSATIKGGIEGKYQVMAIKIYELTDNQLLKCYSKPAEMELYFEKYFTKFKLFPNPNINNKLYLETNKPYKNVELSIFDMRGIYHFKKNFPILDIQVSIDLTDFPGGAYIIQLFGEELKEAQHFNIFR